MAESAEHGGGMHPAQPSPLPQPHRPPLLKLTFCLPHQMALNPTTPYGTHNATQGAQRLTPLGRPHLPWYGLLR